MEAQRRPGGRPRTLARLARLLPTAEPRPLEAAEELAAAGGQLVVRRAAETRRVGSRAGCAAGSGKGAARPSSVAMLGGAGRSAQIARAWWCARGRAAAVRGCGRRSAQSTPPVEQERGISAVLGAARGEARGPRRAAAPLGRRAAVCRPRRSGVGPGSQQAGRGGLQTPTRAGGGRVVETRGAAQHQQQQREPLRGLQLPAEQQAGEERREERLALRHHLGATVRARARDANAGGGPSWQQAWITR